MEKYNKQKLSMPQAFKSTELDQKQIDSKPESGSQILGDNHTQQNEFNLDRQEYQQVFKVFDKDNSGEINIQQVYELINKFETDQNLNLNPGESIKKSATQGKSYGISSSLYSNGTKKVDSGIQGSRQSHHKGQQNGIENTAASKFSPQRKQINGGNAQSGQNSNSNALQGSNILQLRPTQLTTLNNNPNFNKETNMNNNRSPRRHSHLYHAQKADQNGVKNEGSRPMTIKLNGIGGANNANNSQVGSSKSDGKSNNADESHPKDDNSPGIKAKIKKQGTAQIGGSANNLLQSGATNQQITSSSTPSVLEFPNGKESLKFDEFINIIEDSCNESALAENYLVLAFSMFDRQKKGYISSSDLKEVFSILGEQITDDEVNTMIKIAGIKSNDKINFKEFVDFFYKID